MKAIQIKEFGSANQLYLGESPKPVVSSEEILVRVHATALNRADILQRKGMYPPPSGASDILGLEMAGTVEEVGAAVTAHKIGDPVFGLLSGGGYAEYVAIHQNLAMAIPVNLNFVEAAAIPEVFLTAFQALNYLARLKKGENVLIHAGASGVGTAAIQLAKLMDAGKIIITSSKPKHKVCTQLGAHICVDYQTQDFEAVVAKISKGRGVDVIVDFMAASYFAQNVNSLAMDGRLIMLALMGGTRAEANLAKILSKRLQIIGSTLRARTKDYKIKLTNDFSNAVLSKISNGELIPVIDSVFDWKDVIAAHERMESNQNSGKIVLKVS